LALISLVLPWGQDSGLISGHARSDDLDLAGQSFNGLEASGGSWFGLALGALALFVLLASILRRLRPTNGSRFLSADGITVAGFGMVGAALAYALASPSPVAVDYSHGPGVWVAVLGALLSVGGGMFALRQAPYSAKRPQSSAVAWPRFAGSTIALLIVVASVFSGWVFDQRGGIGDAIPPEIQEQIDELRAQAEDDPSVASANANRVQSLLNQARQSALLIHDGFDADSFQLGPLALVLGLLGLAATVPASGLIGNGDEVWRWRWSTLVAGSGVALMVLATGLIGSTTRVRESQFTTGVGVLLLLTAGFFMLGSARGMLTVFERRKVYADDIAITKGVIEPEGSTDELLVQAGA
jgi:hypothetical protein